MDTEAQNTERDRSPAPDEGPEEGSRFTCAPGRSPVTDEPDGQDTAGRPDKPDVPDESDVPGRRAMSVSWWRAAFVGVACTAVMLLFSAFVLQPFLIPSGSMEPTLRMGDRVLVNKLTYRFGSEPRRGDVVVFDGTGSFVPEAPDESTLTALLRGTAASLGLADPPDTDYVKRVVGVGGDRVVCCDERGRLTVNGAAADEEYLFPGDKPSTVSFDIVVPDGRLWMMGDHRGSSRDSRDHLGQPGGGMVPVDRVIGRADWLGWPVGRLGSVPETAAFDTARPPGGAHG